MNEPFHKIVGQEPIKRRLLHSIECFKVGGVFPHYLFSGAMGNGKGAITKEFCRLLYQHDKEFVAHTINCATIKDIGSFYKQVYLPMIEGKKVLLRFDECHNLEDKIQQLFLSAIDVSDEIEREIPTDFGGMKFNLRDHIFIFMSSEPDKLFPPLKNRMDEISMTSYKQSELGEILKRRCKNISFADQVIEVIASHLRGNPRSAEQMAKKILGYCGLKKVETFTAQDWQDFQYVNDIKPFGLSGNEIEVIKALAQRTECSLNDLRAATNLSRTAIMNDCEPYLTQLRFMLVNKQRQITPKGMAFWQTMQSDD